MLLIIFYYSIWKHYIANKSYSTFQGSLNLNFSIIFHNRKIEEISCEERNHEFPSTSFPMNKYTLKSSMSVAYVFGKKYASLGKF